VDDLLIAATGSVTVTVIVTLVGCVENVGAVQVVVYPVSEEKVPPALLDQA
jgi:hypothetical protein